ncbi:hypothetical protein [Niabella ginsenosidivorans]|uniref:hypothetical protein n=1 Tax=Niabella ginsenosidivorans TaxID=1176587 RepID=UPI001471F2E2|nr:hypothetical protein [Niabella ginsenosidivorans]
MRVEKGIFEEEGIKHNGKVYIQTKDSCLPQVLSLSALAKKYTNVADAPVLFTIKWEPG